MTSNLIGGLSKHKGIPEAITLAIITHQRSHQCSESIDGFPRLSTPSLPITGNQLIPTFSH